MRFDREGCGWPDYLSHEKLFNSANELLKDNKLVVDCEVEFVEEEEIDDEKQSKTNEIVNFVNPNKQTDVTPTQSITQVSYLTHRWTIDNFCFYFKANHKKRSNYLECNKFSPVNDDQIQFVFGFSPRPYHENEQFSIFLDLISEKRTENLSNQLIISVLNENDIVCVSTPRFPAPHLSMANGLPVGRTSKQFNWKDTQMDPKSIKQLKLLFQVRKIQFRIFVELDLVGEPTCNLEIQAPIRILPEIKPLLFNCQPTDMYFQFDGIVHYHIAVLSARSKVFEDLFNRLRDKKAVEDIQLKFDVPTFEVVLRFIYTGQIYPAQMDHVFVEKLLIFADMYQVESLMPICENVLLDHLETAKLAQNIQQSVKYLVLADRHNAKRLKERCITIVNQYAPIIRETSAWSTLLTAHPNVVADLYKNLMTNRKSKSKKKVVSYSVK